MKIENHSKLENLRYRLQVAAAAALAYVSVFIVLTATSPGGLFPDGFAVWEQEVQRSMVEVSYQS